MYQLLYIYSYGFLRYILKRYHFKDISEKKILKHFKEISEKKNDLEFMSVLRELLLYYSIFLI